MDTEFVTANQTPTSSEVTVSSDYLDALATTLSGPAGDVKQERRRPTRRMSRHARAQEQRSRSAASVRKRKVDFQDSRSAGKRIRDEDSQAAPDIVTIFPKAKPESASPSNKTKIPVRKVEPKRYSSFDAKKLPPSPSSMGQAGSLQASSLSVRVQRSLSLQQIAPSEDAAEDAPSTEGKKETDEQKSEKVCSRNKQSGATGVTAPSSKTLPKANVKTRSVTASHRATSTVKQESTKTKSSLQWEQQTKRRVPSILVIHKREQDSKTKLESKSSSSVPDSPMVCSSKASLSLNTSPKSASPEAAPSVPGTTSKIRSINARSFINRSNKAGSPKARSPSAGRRNASPRVADSSAPGPTATGSPAADCPTADCPTADSPRAGSPQAGSSVDCSDVFNTPIGSQFKTGLSKAIPTKSASPRTISSLACSSQAASPRATSPRDVTPRAVSPRTVSPRPVSPRPVSPRPVSTRPVSTRPVSPRPVSPRPVSPRPVSPRPVSPKPVSPRPVSPRPVSPRPVSPRAFTPSAVSPRAITPKAVSPRAASPNAVAQKAGLSITDSLVTAPLATTLPTSPSSLDDSSQSASPRAVSPRAASLKDGTPATGLPITSSPVTTPPVCPSYKAGSSGRHSPKAGSLRVASPRTASPAIIQHIIPSSVDASPNSLEPHSPKAGAPNIVSPVTASPVTTLPVSPTSVAASRRPGSLTPHSPKVSSPKTKTGSPRTPSPDTTQYVRPSSLTSSPKTTSLAPHSATKTGSPKADSLATTLTVNPSSVAATRKAGSLAPHPPKVDSPKTCSPVTAPPPAVGASSKVGSLAAHSPKAGPPKAVSPITTATTQPASPPMLPDVGTPDVPRKAVLPKTTSPNTISPVADPSKAKSTKPTRYQSQEVQSANEVKPELKIGTDTKYGKPLVPVPRLRLDSKVTNENKEEDTRKKSEKKETSRDTSKSPRYASKYEAEDDSQNYSGARPNPRLQSQSLVDGKVQKPKATAVDSSQKKSSPRKTSVSEATSHLKERTPRSKAEEEDITQRSSPKQKSQFQVQDLGLKGHSHSPQSTVNSGTTKEIREVYSRKKWLTKGRARNIACRPYYKPKPTSNNIKQDTSINLEIKDIRQVTSNPQPCKKTMKGKDFADHKQKTMSSAEHPALSPRSTGTRQADLNSQQGMKSASENRGLEQKGKTRKISPERLELVKLYEGDVGKKIKNPKTETTSGRVQVTALRKFGEGDTNTKSAVKDLKNEKHGHNEKKTTCEAHDARNVKRTAQGKMERPEAKEQTNTLTEGGEQPSRCSSITVGVQTCLRDETGREVNEKKYSSARKSAERWRLQRFICPSSGAPVNSTIGRKQLKLTEGNSRKQYGTMDERIITNVVYNDSWNNKAKLENREQMKTEKFIKKGDKVKCSSPRTLIAKVKSAIAPRPTAFSARSKTEVTARAVVPAVRVPVDHQVTTGHPVYKHNLASTKPDRCAGIVRGWNPVSDDFSLKEFGKTDTVGDRLRTRAKGAEGLSPGSTARDRKKKYGYTAGSLQSPETLFVYRGTLLSRKNNKPNVKIGYERFNKVSANSERVITTESMKRWPVGNMAVVRHGASNVKPTFRCDVVSSITLAKKRIGREAAGTEKAIVKISASPKTERLSKQQVRATKDVFNRLFNSYGNRFTRRYSSEVKQNDFLKRGTEDTPRKQTSTKSSFDEKKKVAKLQSPRKTWVPPQTLLIPATEKREVVPLEPTRARKQYDTKRLMWVHPPGLSFTAQSKHAPVTSRPSSKFAKPCNESSSVRPECLKAKPTSPHVQPLKKDSSESASEPSDDGVTTGNELKNKLGSSSKRKAEHPRSVAAHTPAPVTKYQPKLQKPVASKRMPEKAKRPLAVIRETSSLESEQEFSEARGSVTELLVRPNDGIVITDSSFESLEVLVPGRGASESLREVRSVVLDERSRRTSEEREFVSQPSVRTLLCVRTRPRAGEEGDETVVEVARLDKQAGTEQRLQVTLSDVEAVDVVRAALRDRDSDVASEDSIDSAKTWPRASFVRPATRLVAATQRHMSLQETSQDLRALGAGELLAAVVRTVQRRPLVSDLRWSAWMAALQSADPEAAATPFPDTLLRAAGTKDVAAALAASERVPALWLLKDLPAERLGDAASRLLYWLLVDLPRAAPRVHPVSAREAHHALSCPRRPCAAFSVRLPAGSAVKERLLRRAGHFAPFEAWASPPLWKLHALLSGAATPAGLLSLHMDGALKRAQPGYGCGASSIAQRMRCVARCTAVWHPELVERVSSEAVVVRGQDLVAVQQLLLFAEPLPAEAPSRFRTSRRQLAAVAATIASAYFMFCAAVWLLGDFDMLDSDQYYP